MISPGLRHLGKKGVLCLMVIFWLGVMALSLFPQLHRLLHEDSGSLNHECLLTSINKSHLLIGAADGATLSAPAIVFCVCLLGEFFSLALVHYRFSPGRAPPSGLLFTPGC